MFFLHLCGSIYQEYKLNVEILLFIILLKSNVLFYIFYLQEIKIIIYRQIALKALSERLSKDHAKPWQQDRSKKHSPIPSAVSVQIPEPVIPKPLPSPLIPQISVNIHNHPSTSSST